MNGDSMTSTLRKSILLAVIITLIFPIDFLVEAMIGKFWIAYVEETLIRFIPFLFIYLIYPISKLYEKIELGIVGGLTFGLLELFVKLLTLTPSVLMLLPLFFVHVVNGVIMSILVGESIENRYWVLLPFAWIICSLWHSVWNTIVGFI